MFVLKWCMCMERLTMIKLVPVKLGTSKKRPSTYMLYYCFLLRLKVVQSYLVKNAQIKRPSCQHTTATTTALVNTTTLFQCWTLYQLRDPDNVVALQTIIIYDVFSLTVGECQYLCGSRIYSVSPFLTSVFSQIRMKELWKT